MRDATMPDDQKMKQLVSLGRTESSFLRLRRTRLGLADFRTVKVIGKGAFGEVGRVCVLLLYIPMFLAGPPRAKDRHGQDLRNEDSPQIRNVQKGSGGQVERYDRVYK